MGNGVGVHDEKDVENLTTPQRQELKAEIIKQVQNFKGIKPPIEQELESFMKSNPDIQRQVRDAVKPTYDKLKGNK